MNFNKIELGAVYKPTIESKYKGYGFMRVMEKIPRSEPTNKHKVNLLKVQHSQNTDFNFAFIRVVCPRDLEES